MKYTKPPLPFDNQVKLLQQRGLHIEDPKKACHILEHINYYRLSAYFPPLQKQPDQFIAGTTLDDVLHLYEFDCILRNLLVEGLASIEVSAKTQIAYHLALKYGSFCYLNADVFDFRQPTHEKWLYKVKDNIRKSNEDFVKHFFKKYDEEKSLPIWMVVEILSFGQVSQLYRGMKKHDRQDIARGYFKLDQRLMNSWLHSIVYVRNLCAHHSRVWNRKLAIPPVRNKKDSAWDNLENSKIFCILMLMKRMMHYQDLWDKWSSKFLSLVAEYSDIDLKNMGFPEDWRNRLFIA